ncbi:MAG: acyl carrier protein [Treponema sp.]|nr:acyl carrier protein [Treponema sp.]
MNRDEIFKKLNEVFRDIFDDDSITLTDSTTASDVEGWDSLMHISLINAVQDEFGRKFAMKDVTGMKNVGQMVDLILAAKG